MNRESSNDLGFVYNYEEPAIIEDEYYDEYIYQEEPEDQVTYVLPSQRFSEDSGTEEVSASVPQRPGHARTIPGIYDELDYTISPRVTPESTHQHHRGNEGTQEKSNKEFLIFNKKVFIIASILLTCVIGGVIVGVIFFLQGTIKVPNQNKGNLGSELFFVCT